MINVEHQDWVSKLKRDRRVGTIVGWTAAAAGLIALFGTSFSSGTLDTALAVGGSVAILAGLVSAGFARASHNTLCAIGREYKAYGEYAPMIPIEHLGQSGL